MLRAAILLNAYTTCFAGENAEDNAEQMHKIVYNAEFPIIKE